MSMPEQATLSVSASLVGAVCEVLVERVLQRK